ncbi:hypothetical protein K0M31_001838 [Melipona bicolor]|uniref:Uncharacterized protein n=1 Tax=Melipona bicolor TaxID=60889 RepID=A0AA40GGD3_9HYME|nr:hypothetical protein K0M31_001838 [Melipona bicolor]
MADRSNKNRSSSQKRTRRKRSIQSPTSTEFGGLFARGVLSILPGSKLTIGIADFVFKSLGYTTVKNITMHDDYEVTAGFQTTGLTALFHLALKDILFKNYTPIECGKVVYILTIVPADLDPLPLKLFHKRHRVRNVGCWLLPSYFFGPLKSVDIMILHIKVCSLAASFGKTSLKGADWTIKRMNSKDG